ncbi:YqzE family protein [Bacillus mangrovi]|uniref:YqzE family protein n=1 Tax=Metabacillus mangrovi TaxID=1491830 RepID=A0A7X2V3U5_9BACI|nr:YqzE family protein [Metabacillus mangrovi]MTH52396.1 YqzE family protein [Metabacillus mangrovi]
MSSNDYVKYLTQQVVKYMDTPKEEREQQKELKKSAKTPFWSRWFGVLPVSMLLLMRKKRKK